MNNTELQQWPLKCSPRVRYAVFPCLRAEACSCCCTAKQKGTRILGFIHVGKNICQNSQVLYLPVNPGASVPCRARQELRLPEQQPGLEFSSCRTDRERKRGCRIKQSKGEKLRSAPVSGFCQQPPEVTSTNFKLCLLLPSIERKAICQTLTSCYITVL